MRMHRNGARRLHRLAWAGLAALSIMTSVVATCAPAAAAPTLTVFGSAPRPTIAVAADGGAVELGLRFSSPSPLLILGVRFLRRAGAQGTHTASLWSAQGTLLARVTFTRETATGWQQAIFSHPVVAQAGQEYVASYFAPRGRYAYSYSEFTRPSVRSGIVLPQDAGVFRYGGGFPTGTWRSSNYYVDVLYSKLPTPPGTAPAAQPSPSGTPTGTAPAAPPAAGSAPTAPVKAGVPSGMSLKKYTGPFIITTPGTVVDGYDVPGTLEIQTTGVIIRNSRISGTGDYGVFVRSGSLTIQDSTIKGFDNSMTGDNYTATRVEVTAANEDGFKIGDNVTIQDSWCHDLIVTPGAHSDCGQVQSGVRNVVIRGNWLDPTNPKANSALFLAPDLGPSSPGPLLVENNTLGGGNYTLFCVDGNNGQYFISNITIRNNRFLDDYRYGPMRVNVAVTASGNVMAATGTAVE
jgi:Domain of unknown function (DUF4082)